jgi:uncharacterized protein
VYRNMYLTGGIGSSGSNEGFSVDYDLPNEEAYCETCASVGMVLWNQRMNLLTGDSKYIDVLERSLYNGALDGLSLSGDRFFYGNPLASEGNYGRSEWFGTACCPSNISRLIASIGGYIYATSKNSIWINLFIGSNTTIATGKSKIRIEQLTDYPWKGLVTFRVSPDRKTKHVLRIRIPDWAIGQPVPGETYRYLDTLSTKSRIKLAVNGKPISYKVENGYAVIDREWKYGDQVELDLPMKARRVVSADRVIANRNKVAIERGPLVYCLEHPDNNGHVYNIVLPDKAELVVKEEESVLGNIMSIEANADVAVVSGDGTSISTETRKIKAIPYYAWANRGPGEMQVWIPRKASVVFLK